MTKDNDFTDKFHLDGIPPVPRGAPQIGVVHHIDVNGSRNASAQDKSTGKSDQGRSSRTQIDCLLHAAEKYRDDGEVYKMKIDAMKRFENYCLAAHNSHTEEKFKGEFEAEDEDNVVQDAQNWLDKYP